METSSKNPGRVREGVRLALIGVLGLALGLAGSRFVPAPWDAAGEAVAEASAEVPATVPSPPEPPPPQRDVHRDTVRKGDTASGLFRDLLSPQQIHDLAAQSKPVFPLTRFCAGQPYELCTVDGRFESFVYEIDSEERLVIQRDGREFRVAREPIEYTVETAVVQGEIRSSLFEAVGELGESPELAIRLSDIFAWDIDFILDIREGDSFQALVERRFRDDQPAGYGRILAAQFVNQGEVYDAVLYQDGDRAPSYYDRGGNSLRKAFLRAPLAFSRISSGYSKRRFHPITKTWKSHPAIDYAAPAGTPIKAVGDGTVVERGYTSGNGNYVRIRHNSTYETLYLHMSRFAKAARRGSKVTQGEIIGYVGSTGLATGPHLCFRMYRNGSPVNPYGVKQAAAAPVSRENMPEFEALATTLTARFGVDRTEQARLSEASAGSVQ